MNEYNEYVKALDILEFRLIRDSRGRIRRLDKESGCAINILKELVNKQIPVLLDESGYTSMCPKCNSGAYGVGINYTDRDFFYCPVCGQKLSLKMGDYE